MKLISLRVLERAVVLVVEDVFRICLSGLDFVTSMV